MDVNIHTFLDMIKFGTVNTLINVQDTYYKYGWNRNDVEDKGLKI